MIASTYQCLVFFGVAQEKCSQKTAVRNEQDFLASISNPMESCSSKDANILGVPLFAVSFIAAGFLVSLSTPLPVGRRQVFEI